MLSFRYLLTPEALGAPEESGLSRRIGKGIESDRYARAPRLTACRRSHLATALGIMRPGAAGVILVKN
jgi:hypothetical protein